MERELYHVGVAGGTTSKTADQNTPGTLLGTPRNHQNEAGTQS